MLNLQDMRQDYKKAELSEESVDESPFVQFEKWFGDAQTGNIGIRKSSSGKPTGIFAQSSK